jgi:outer membrane protein assembly factor BamB
MQHCWLWPFWRGCSSNSKKELPPAELTDFKEEVVLQKQWSRSVTARASLQLLRPAIDGDTIYAAPPKA